MVYDVGVIRGQYPALADGRSWLDSAAGTQVPQTVIDAVTETYRTGVANQGGMFEASRRSGELVERARDAVRDLVGAERAAPVILGPSMTALTYRIAEALAARWRPGDEIVVTQLDHDANVRPWVQAAERRGVTVRTAPLDHETGDLPVERIAPLIGERTRVVAVTAASNLLGAMPDVPRIVELARSVGAVSYVDGVHHCPHSRVDLASWRPDFYVTSAYKWAGPHVAAVIAADAARLSVLRPDKLAPAPDGPAEQFERGTHPFPALAGVVAAVDHLAELDGAAEGDRVERLTRSRDAVVAHENGLLGQLTEGLAALPGVVRHGGPRGRQAPTVLFGVEGREPADVAGELARRGIHVSHGYSYAWEAMRALGFGVAGGVRASLCHYNDETDVRRLLAALRELVRTG